MRNVRANIAHRLSLRDLSVRSHMNEAMLCFRQPYGDRQSRQRILGQQKASYHNYVRLGWITDAAKQACRMWPTACFARSPYVE
jgi:hypothetical protein